MTNAVRTNPRVRLAAVAASAALTVGSLGQMPVTKVVVAEAQWRELPATATLVGTVDAVRRSRVGAEVGGIVVDMPVRQGDRVEAGQLLCKLNDDLISYELAEAKARHGSLEARHEELLAGTRKEVLDRLKALVAEAEAIRKRWGYERERVRRLYADAQAGSQKEVYDAEAQFLAAEQRKFAAQASYEEAVKGPRAEVIARAAHDVAEQKAVVLRLESELSKTEIRAPFAGFVVNRVVELGEWVSPGGQVVELADLSTVLVRVDVPESALPYCTVGEPVRVKVDAVGRTFIGKIKHRIPLADKAARTFPVEVELDNPQSVISYQLSVISQLSTDNRQQGAPSLPGAGDGSRSPTLREDGAPPQPMLAAGMFARVTVPAGPRQKTVAVPKDAIVDRQGTSYVVKVVPGERGALMGIPVPVRIGADIGGWVAIVSHNIQPGMRLIVRGNERIEFPQPVEIVDEMGSPVKGKAEKLKR